jgi:hypothetical protein
MATYKLKDGATVSDSMSFTFDGIQYPENWIKLSTAADRKRIGLTGPLPEPPWYDQQFYWGPDQPKDHAELVELYCGYVRLNANALLRDTDWQVIREADNGTPVSADVKAWREAIRLASNEKAIYLGTTNSTEELAAYVTGTEYPTWPSIAAAGVPVS